MLSLNELVDRVRTYQPGADVDLIGRAYAYGEKAHAGQTRKSGEPYFSHPASVAAVITSLKLDTASVCAGLLHDVVEDTLATTTDIEREFGQEVAFLVDGVTKLSKINFASKEDRQAENFRKMLVAMARDIRVLLVKLCDRLDNMRTLEHMKPEAQDRISRETMEIYAPLANRLGIARFKSELEDLSFRWLEPAAYADLEKKVHSSESDRSKYITEVCKVLALKLAKQGFAADVTGRAKHLYSIYRKMQSQQCDFDQVYDVVAFRVLVESVADCYASLGVIHSQWTPVPGRFKDYVALPKPNMYQSLHTTVIGPGRERIEVQIRSHDMNRVAEQGIAAHWKYKENNSGGIDPKDAARFGWLRQLMEFQKDLKDPAEFLESVKVDLFQDEVYVFTPKGDVRVFPRGSTPIDFAYAIHSRRRRPLLGRPRQRRHRAAPLQAAQRRRRRGDAEPRPAPLEGLAGVRRHRAGPLQDPHLPAHRAARPLPQAGQGAAREGDALPEHEPGPPRQDARGDAQGDGALRRLQPADELYVAVGYGKVSPRAVTELLSPPKEGDKGSEPPSSLREGRIESLVRKVTGKDAAGIRLNGIDDVLVRYTKCCNPLPGDEIVGFITRGRGITVHRRNCTKAFDTDPERRVEISWDSRAKINRPVQIKVMTANRPGILATVGHTFHEQGINISEATCRAGDDGRAMNTFTFLCSDLAQLKNVIRQLQRIPGVMAVERT